MVCTGCFDCDRRHRIHYRIPRMLRCNQGEFMHGAYG